MSRTGIFLPCSTRIWWARRSAVLTCSGTLRTRRAAVGRAAPHERMTFHSSMSGRPSYPATCPARPPAPRRARPPPLRLPSWPTMSRSPPSAFRRGCSLPRDCKRQRLRWRREFAAAARRALLFELSRYLKVDAVEADGRAVDFLQNPALSKAPSCAEKRTISWRWCFLLRSHPARR
jgi:hypothetical protein